MQKMTKVLALTAALIFSSTAFAGKLSDYPNVQDLLNNDNVVLYTYWGCLDDGYALNNSEYQPIYYLVPPEGEHTMGSVTLTLSKRVGGPYSLTTQYIHVRIDIIDDGEGNLRVGTTTIERSTVY